MAAQLGVRDSRAAAGQHAQAVSDCVCDECHGSDLRLDREWCGSCCRRTGWSRWCRRSSRCRTRSRSRRACRRCSRRIRGACSGSRSGPRSWRSPSRGTSPRPRPRSARPAPAPPVLLRPVHVLAALVGAHRQHALQRADHRRRCRRRSAGWPGTCTGMRICLTSGISPLMPIWPALAADGDRRQRRHVPDHGQRAVLGVQRQRHLPLHRHLVDRAACARLPARLRECRRCAPARSPSGSFGSRKMSSWAWYRSWSCSTLAASWMRSASYSSTPR